MTGTGALIDRVLEVPVVTSFTRLGYDVRSRTEHWRKLDSYDMSGQVVVITGATSGIGLAAASQMARCGADLILVGRDQSKTRAVADRIAADSGNNRLSIVVADMGELDSVRSAAEQISAGHDHLDVLIHNAGALLDTRRTTSEGIEATVASQVVGPFLMTTLLFDLLATSSRVLTMSSGGMYATGLTVSNLEMDDATYRGAEQYARAKRAQVTLNQMWAERTGDSGVRFHAMHPGWADTPGVEKSLPAFRRVVGPLLRSPEQGADTLVWLAADDGAPLDTNGEFWLDRRPRSIHKLASTRRTDTPDRRERLWEWVAAAAGVATPSPYRP
jgi:NAD(P)-dependent dehydrogenase (short-subunit alcohol dehydrogenase family)